MAEGQRELGLSIVSNPLFVHDCSLCSFLPVIIPGAIAVRNGAVLADFASIRPRLSADAPRLHYFNVFRVLSTICDI